MVCIPCFIIPAVLFIWYRFLQPLVLKIWNPFGTKVAAPPGNKPVSDGKQESETKACPATGSSSEGKCPISAFSSKDTTKID